MEASSSSSSSTSSSSAAVVFGRVGSGITPNNVIREKESLRHTMRPTCVCLFSKTEGQTDDDKMM